MALKILIYCDDNSGGGAAMATHRLALGLRARGHEILYAQTRTGSPLADERAAHGIRAIDIPIDTLKFFLLCIDETRAPARMFLEHAPDLILFSDALVESTLGAKETAAILKIPYVVLKHLVLDGTLYTRDRTLGERVGRSLAAAARVVAVSEHNRTILARHFPPAAGRMLAVPNSIPDSFFAPASRSRAEFRQAHGIAEHEVAVLTAAALVQRKGYHHTVAAIRQLHAQGALDGLVFVWAGEGEKPYTDGLLAELHAAGCADSVRFIGFQREVAWCLDGSDVLLLPSHQEGMPLVVLEAMARGVPVIASAVGGAPEVLDQGGGILLPDPGADAPGLVAGVCAALSGWVRDPAERARIGTAGRRRAQEAFTTALMLDRYEAVIRRAAFTEGDHIPPTLAAVKPDRALPYLTARPAESGTQPRYVDARYPVMGMLNRDEVLLVHNVALGFAGKPALEIGCWVGWASLHLAAAGVRLDLVDPLLADPTVRDTVVTALAEFASQPVRIAAGSAPAALNGFAPPPEGAWSLFLVDGPRDAATLAATLGECLRRAAPDAAILVAGLAEPEVARTFVETIPAAPGWRARIYRTTGLLGLAWRGTAVPVEHIPDPALAERALPACLDGMA